MLGAQDFCGYYDWTFHHIRKHFGETALKDLWAIAVGTDSQRHYIELGKRDGMKGLFEAWRHTGEDEKCDWTFTLDEARNVLRWDMRKCPSKGFLLQNNLNADEDYCDHCIGWERSMLGTLGMELVHHEHNHCGQCWGEIRVKGKPYNSLQLDCDIRKDPRWDSGFVDRFVDQEKTPSHPEISSSSDPLSIIKAWRGSRALRVVGDLEMGEWVEPDVVRLMSATRFVADPIARVAVLIESPPTMHTLKRLADLRASMPTAHQPILLYPFLPSDVDVPFVQLGLPRPIPILPILIRAGTYQHNPLARPLTTANWLKLLEGALATP